MVFVVSIVLLVVFYFLVLDFQLYLCLEYGHTTSSQSHVVIGFHGFLLVVVFVLAFYVLSLGNWLGKRKS